MTIDFTAIRPIGGSQAKGFEELCAQLASRETPEGADFRRTGYQDAGVECFSVLENGSEWGWQAKYFHTLGDAQWRQLDRSVKTALKKHRTLVRYYVCVPLDLADARVEGRVSAMQRWDQRVETWKCWASEKEMEVEFVWWGSFELLDMLSRPEHVGRTLFWFEERRFDEPWFRSRLDEALNAAGPRYTPKIHVDLPIAQQLEVFGRTEAAFDRIRLPVREIRRAISRIGRTGYRDEQHKDLESELVDLVQSVTTTLEDFDTLYRPDGTLPIAGIIESISRVASEVVRIAEEYRLRAAEYKAEYHGTQSSSRDYDNPYRERYSHVARLERNLDECYKSLAEFDSVSNYPLMILTGDGGTGKTHLLCDFANKRVECGAPTVLLMGQQYLSHGDPWRQTLEHLDLHQLTREEFIGSLEAAAQVANSRALVIIDAVNEGQGRNLWWHTLASFLSPLIASPWIGVILSVRSPYEDYVIPDRVKEHATIIKHEGFTGVEFYAAAILFNRYGIEFPSTPILQPEFGNPLFLKTLCKGLQRLGQSTLPRGSQGVTSIFDTYLTSLNRTLADDLDYDRGDNLVRQAVEGIARRLADEDIEKRWLAKSEAREIVDNLLPGRTFSESLYRRLVSEGVLLETISGGRESPEEVVQISYERFADHVIVDTLLNDNLDTNDPEKAFREQGRLAFFRDNSRYLPYGILEALCIQIPERTGRELSDLVPGIKMRTSFGRVFRRSIAWRRIDAFSDSTEELFDEFTLQQFRSNRWDLDDALEILLTVATIPDHPFNADFLHCILSRDSMPIRDAWWSIYLHDTWDNEMAVDRLVQWASGISSVVDLEEDVVDLCSTTLAWMLSTPNRFLRDKATKALVSLLTGRFDSTARLVDRFSDVDDPYVLERVYAVAYGVALRSDVAEDVGGLAQVVYGTVFAAGAPPVQILLRNYARGVVEHAIRLQANLDVDENLLRPPYKSDWPEIPDEDEVREMIESVGQPAYPFRRSLNNFTGDFYIYVIGRESPPNWLSLRLDEPVWQSPNMKLQAMISTLHDEAQAAWNEYERRQASLEEIRRQNLTLRSMDNEDGLSALVQENPEEVKQAKDDVDSELERFRSLLSCDQISEFDSIVSLRDDNCAGLAPRLDQQLIRRYILRRVFDLGWTEELFGDFDSEVNYDHGREPSKPERIGKKYQWIAYHEILACIADRFQYRRRFSEDTVQSYDGPWQEGLANIDLSCTLASKPGGTHWGGHTASWWAEAEVSDWAEEISPEEWIDRRDDIPQVQDLLIVDDPRGGTRWVNLGGFFLWQQAFPADVVIDDVDQREFNAFCTGYFIDRDRVEEFMEWSNDVHFWGRWMPEAFEMHSDVLGEYPWSQAFQYSFQMQYPDTDWTNPDRGCPAPIRVCLVEYHAS